MGKVIIHQINHLINLEWRKINDLIRKYQEMPIFFRLTYYLIRENQVVLTVLENYVLIVENNVGLI